MKQLLIPFISILLTLPQLQAQYKFKSADKHKIIGITLDFTAPIYGESVCLNLEPSLSATSSLNIVGGITLVDAVYSTFFEESSELWISEKEPVMGYHAGLSFRKYMHETEVFDGIFYGPSLHYKEFNSQTKNKCHNALQEPLLFEKRRVLDAGMEFGFAFLLGSYLTELVLEGGARTHFIKGETCMEAMPFRVHLEETYSHRILPYFKMGLRMGFVVMRKPKQEKG